MEDFIEIIFYVVILVLSGVGSLLKNKKKQEKPIFSSKSNEEVRTAETGLDEEVVVIEDAKGDDEENELVRMLREAAVAAEAQQRAKEALEQQYAEELRQKEIAEQQRKVEQFRLEQERKLAKQQVKLQKERTKVANVESSSVFDLDLSDVNEARRAFIASEIFNKRYC